MRHPPLEPQVVEADLTWTGGRFEPGVQIAIAATGRIEAVGRLGRAPTRRLAGQALLPGFVNVHSHAFQRGLRGRGEHFPADAGSFWTWREAMYRLVETLDADGFFRLSTQAFGEMLDAGITAVGEFHYLHHSPGTAADYAFDELLLAAADAAGIRIVLLNAYYARGGIGQPLAGPQRRFATADLRRYWRQMDRLDSQRDPATQAVGVAAHSVRAVEPDDIASLYREARARDLVFHAHVEEQRRESDECLAAYGRRPLALLTELGIGGDLTAVHCTHTEPDDLSRFLAAGGAVCVCPTTEANLGDGIPDLAPVRAPGERLSLGTDSNARIGMLEEIRWLEYGQRLRRGSRGALAAGGGDLPAILLHAATEGGARALGIAAGRIEPERWADFVVVDLRHPALAGADASSLPAALVFGAGNEVVRATAVGGRWRGKSLAAN